MLQHTPLLLTMSLSTRFSSCYITHFTNVLLSLFFFNDTAPTEIYTLSLHDALPISLHRRPRRRDSLGSRPWRRRACRLPRDRKSTRLNSSHANISYAVFCLKKKKKKNTTGEDDVTESLTHLDGHKRQSMLRQNERGY